MTLFDGNKVKGDYVKEIYAHPPSLEERDFNWVMGV